MNILPFSAGSDWIDPELSCKDAYHDMAEAATYDLRAYVVRAEARLSEESRVHFAIPHIPIPRGFRDLRQFTLDLPIETLKTAAFGWVVALMSLHLDKLTIKLTDTVEDTKETMGLGIHLHVASASSSYGFPQDPDMPWLHHAALSLKRVSGEIDQFGYMNHEGNTRLPPWQRISLLC
jgi:hypothetical protein